MESDFQDDRTFEAFSPTETDIGNDISLSDTFRGKKVKVDQSLSNKIKSKISRKQPKSFGHGRKISVESTGNFADDEDVTSGASTILSPVSQSNINGGTEIVQNLSSVHLDKVPEKSILKNNHNLSKLSSLKLDRKVHVNAPASGDSTANDADDEAFSPLRIAIDLDSKLPENPDRKMKSISKNARRGSGSIRHDSNMKSSISGRRRSHQQLSLPAQESNNSRSSNTFKTFNSFALLDNNVLE